VHVSLSFLRSFSMSHLCLSPGLVFYRHTSGKVLWKRPVLDDDASARLQIGPGDAWRCDQSPSTSTPAGSCLVSPQGKTLCLSPPSYTPKKSPPPPTPGGSSHNAFNDGALTEQLECEGWKRSHCNFVYSDHE